MKTLWSASAPVLALCLASLAHAAPQLDQETGFYRDELTDQVGLAGLVNATLDPLTGLVMAVPGQLGIVTTKDITPSALIQWRQLYLKGNGTFTVQVQTAGGGSTLGSLTLVPSDDPAFTVMADLDAIPPTTAAIRLRITVFGQGPSTPNLDRLEVGWSPRTSLRLAATPPAPELCSGATGTWRFPFSVSNVTARDTVVYVPLPDGTHAAPDFGQDARLVFISASGGGRYHPGPGPLVVDGVSVPARSVYWELGDVRFGSSFPLTLTAQIPSGTLDQTSYVLTARGRASNSPDEVVATAATVTSDASPQLSVTKSFTGLHRIGDVWRALDGSTVGVRLTVSNAAGQCRATARRVVLWDPLDLTTVPGGDAPFAGPPTLLTPDLIGPAAATYHSTGAANHPVVVPGSAVHADVGDLAPGASRTFEFSVPLKNMPAWLDRVVTNTAYADSGYAPHAGQVSGNASFTWGLDFTPRGQFAKGERIRQSAAISAGEDNVGLSVGYGETYSYLLNASNRGASVLVDTFLFDKLPSGVELVEARAPLGAVAYYHAGGSGAAPGSPPDYDASNGLLATGVGQWSTTPTTPVTWVAFHVPRLGSSIVTNQNAGAPTSLTAELVVRVPSSAQGCTERDVVNDAFFHNAAYLDAAGTRLANTQPGTLNRETTRVAVEVPSFASAFASSTPSVALGAGRVDYRVTFTNQFTSNPALTDTASNVVVRVTVPRTSIGGITRPIDILGVTAPGGAVDYAGLPDYFDVAFGDVAPAGVVRIDVQASVPRGVVDGATARLDARITYTDSEPGACPVQPNVASATTTFRVEPYLELDKQVDFAVAGHGDLLTYTLTSRNTGDGAARDTVLFDKIPDDMIFVDAFIPANGQRLWFSAADVPDLPVDVRADHAWDAALVTSSGLFQPGLEQGGVVVSPVANPRWIAVLVDDQTLSPPQLPATGEARVVRFRLRVPDATELPEDSLIVNEAIIAARGLLPAVSNLVVTLVSDDPALDITGLCPTAVASGENVSLSYVFTNNSTNDDDVVETRLLVPPGLTAQSLTLASSEGTVTITPPFNDASHAVSATTSAQGLLIRWGVTTDLAGPLGPGQAVTMTLALTVDPLATGTALAVNVTGTADNAAPGVVEVGTQCRTVVANPELRIQKLVDRGQAVTGDTLQYTLIIDNDGPHAVGNAIIREALPPGLALVPGSVRVSPAGWSFQSLEPHVTGATDPENSGAVMEWSLQHNNALVGPSGVPGFLPGESDNIYVTFQANVVTASAGTLIENCARVANGPEQNGDQLVDDDPTNNLACVTTRVPNPDPRITKLGPNTVLPGENFGYRLVFSNGSRQGASDVVFYERLPSFDGDNNADLSFVGASVPAGVTAWYSDAPFVSMASHPVFDPNDPSGWTSDASSLPVVNWIAFHVEELAGSAPPRELEVLVSARDPVGQALLVAGQLFENCVRITLPGVDEDPSNNDSCIITRVPGLNVAITKLCEPSGYLPGARPGDPVSFGLVLENRGTTEAYGLVVTDPLPSWFTLETLSVVAEAEDNDGAESSFIDETGAPILGGVTWTHTGDTHYLGATAVGSPRFFRKVGLRPGHRTRLTVSGRVVSSVEANTLASNTATLETRRQLDTDLAEAADVLFDNASECSFTVHRPDPLIAKSAELEGESGVAGAGESIQYRLAYGNDGLAAADDVVLEDTIPDGLDFIVGSLIDLPTDAVVEYFGPASGTATWGYAPVGDVGDADPDVLAFRVRFGSFPFPLNGVFDQSNAAGFARGTFDGTMWSEELGAVIVAPTSLLAEPSYTTPLIPTDGDVSEWIGLIARGLPGSDTPAIDILDSAGTVLFADIALDGGGAFDLSGLDPTTHPAIRLRARFTNPGATRYDSVSYLDAPGLPTNGTVTHVVGDRAYGMTSRDPFFQLFTNYFIAKEVGVWDRVGASWRLTRLPLPATYNWVEYIAYADATHVVAFARKTTQGTEQAVPVHYRQVAGVWSAPELVPAGFGTLLGIAPLGANDGLCGLSGCVGFVYSSGGQFGSSISVHYLGPSGWAQVQRGNGFPFCNPGQVNTLGVITQECTTRPVVYTPTGSGFALESWPSATAQTTYRQARLSRDGLDLLIPREGTVGRALLHYRFNGATWTLVETIVTNETLNSRMSKDAWLTDQSVLRLIAGDLQQFPLDLGGATGLHAFSLSVSDDGVVAGVRFGVPPSDSQEYTFWALNAAATGYERLNQVGAVTPSLTTNLQISNGGLGWAITATSTGSTFGFVPVATPQPAMRGLTFDRLTYSPFALNSIQQVAGASSPGWFGSARNATQHRPVLWRTEDIQANHTVPATELPTPPPASGLSQNGRILGASPEGCMIGELQTAQGLETYAWRTVANQWVPYRFETAAGFTNLTFVAEGPDGRLFGHATGADSFSKVVEFVCAAGTLTPVALNMGTSSQGQLRGFVNGLLYGSLDLGEGFDPDVVNAYWLASSTDTRLLTLEQDNTFVDVFAIRAEGTIVYGTGFDSEDSAQVGVAWVADNNPNDFDDFELTILPLDPNVTFISGSYNSDVSGSDGANRIVGRYSAPDGSHAVVWTRSSETAPWVRTHDLLGHTSPHFLGSGPDAPVFAAQVPGFQVVLITDFDPLTTVPTPFGYSSFDPVGDEQPWKTAALSAGYAVGFALPNYTTAVLSLVDGQPVVAELSHTPLAMPAPGVFVVGDSSGELGIARRNEEGQFITTLFDVATDFDGLQPNIQPSDIGNTSESGTFTAWLTDSAATPNLRAYAFVPDLAHPTGYRPQAMGYGGTATTYSFGFIGAPGTVNRPLPPGDLLGNGCWTFPVIKDIDNNIDNGQGPSTETNNLRLWGCPVPETDTERLAGWTVSYQGTERPSLGFTAQVEQVCQRTITNTATISTSTPELTSDNNLSSVTVPVATADLAVSLTSTRTVVDPLVDASFALSVTLTNTGSNVARNNRLTLSIPADVVTFDPVTWSVPSLAPGQTYTATVYATLESTESDKSYAFALRATSATIDCNPGDDMATLVVLSGAHPDVRVTKTGPTSVRVFETFQWDLTWSNVGNIAVNGLSVVDTLPAPLTGASVTTSGGYPDLEVGESTLTWPNEALDVDELHSDTVSAVITDCAAVGTTLTNIIEAPLEGDANPSDNSAAWSTQVLGPAAAVSVELVASQPVVRSGETAFVTAHYRSTGTATAQDARLVLTLGAAPRLDSIGAGVWDGTHLSYTLPPLPPGAVGSVTFALGDVGALTASGVVIPGPSGNFCPGPADTVAMTRGSGVTLAKTADRNVACPGGDELVTWTLLVTNPASGTLVTNLQVADQIVGYVAGSGTGPGFSATPELDGVGLDWTIPSLAPGAAVVLTFQSRVAASPDGYARNQASFAGMTLDGAIAGTSNEAVVASSCEPALALTKTLALACDGDPQTVTVVLTYANRGGVAVDGVIVSDFVGHLGATSVTAPGATVSNGVVTWALGTLAPGQVGTLSYTASVAFEIEDNGRLLSDRASIQGTAVRGQTSNQALTPILVCDDGDRCTIDTCTPTGCTHTVIDDCVPCEPTGLPDLCDGVDDDCDDVEGEDDTCEDDTTCTVGECVAGTCVQTPTDAACDDLDQCTSGDRCEAGACVGDPVPDRPVACGTGACTTPASGVETCVADQWVDNCDEVLWGVIPDTTCVPLDVVYAIVEDAQGDAYGTIRCFQDQGTGTIRCDTQSPTSSELVIYPAFYCPMD